LLATQRLARDVAARKIAYQKLAADRYLPHAIVSYEPHRDLLPLLENLRGENRHGSDAGKGWSGKIGRTRILDFSCYRAYVALDYSLKG